MTGTSSSRVTMISDNDKPSTNAKKIINLRSLEIPIFVFKKDWALTQRTRKAAMQTPHELAPAMQVEPGKVFHWQNFSPKMELIETGETMKIMRVRVMQPSKNPFSWSIKIRQLIGPNLWSISPTFQMSNFFCLLPKKYKHKLLLDNIWLSYIYEKAARRMSMKLTP